MLVVGKPKVLSRKRFLKRVERILERQQFTNSGPQVQELEEAVKNYTGVECVAVSNATVALELLARNLRHKKVTLPSFTFIATAHAFAGQVCPLDFCDIDPSFGISPSMLESRVTQAVCAVNLFGGACVVDELETLCQDRGLPLIFDSAHALGVSYKGRPLGDRGVAEVFSLHSTKFIAGGEGGLVTTKHVALAEHLREVRNFGFDPSCSSPHGKLSSWGTNAKMSEFHAALALTNLEDMEDLREHNFQNWQLYYQRLQGIVSIFDADVETHVDSNYSYVVLRVNPFTRDALLEHLYANGVYARKYFDPPVHTSGQYYCEDSLPVTEALASSVVCLPTGPAVSRKDVKQVCKLIRQFLKANSSH